MASSMVNNSFSLCIGLNSKYKTRGYRFLARGASVGPNPSVPPLKITNYPTRPGTLVGTSSSFPEGDKNQTTDDRTPEKLEVLWDDGFGKVSAKDYIDACKDIISRDSGSPRWFCPVECGQPLKGSPVLLFLPGIDGTGMGLILHHKPLGRMFEVRCLHIPIYDRTPFEELVDLVEETVRLEHASSPTKPIYLVGDSIGGCLALAVAARNPTIDLVLILSNPATSFHRSPVDIPTLEALFPHELYFTVPYLMSFTLSEPFKMAMAAIDGALPLRVKLQQQCENLISIASRLHDFVNIIPRETLLWRLKLMESAASYANSQLHNIEAEVLVLASGKDNMLPSADEAQRLKQSIKKCDIRIYNKNGHMLLQERGFSLATVIKGASFYRRSQRHDFVSDFLPPSIQEFEALSRKIWFFQNALHPMVLSTLDDGKLVRGLAGVPSEGPVLLVGNHLSSGLELFSLIPEFLAKKNISLRGMAHLAFFTEKLKHLTSDVYLTDWMRIVGAIPVTGDNLMKLMAAKSHALLYPGGTHEGLHFRGETHQLFWPEKPEFVRIAAKFGATIVPFGVVGEDDLAKLVLDYKDLMKIPMVNDYVQQWSHDLKIECFGPRRAELERELFPPVLVPNLMSGRLYFLFGKPIDMRGKEGIVQDREAANELYLKIKSEVEHNVSYLLRKREEDPYRNALERLVYRMSSHPASEVPTFEL